MDPLPNQKVAIVFCLNGEKQSRNILTFTYLKVGILLVTGFAILVTGFAILYYIEAYRKSVTAAYKAKEIMPFLKSCFVLMKADTWGTYTLEN